MAKNVEVNNSKIVVITGVTRGLGRAMVEEFIRRGHTVIGCGRSESAINDLHKSLGAPHEITALDVADDNAVQSWAQKALAKFGPPDLLINNAAIINQNAPFWQVPAAEFSSVIDINIKGVANVIRHFVPAMIRKNKGTIVNFSSGWGRSADAEVAPYCATKWAIEGLTKALAQELPSGMAAIPLNPGIIDTAMLRSCFGASAASYPSPEQWASRAVPYLLTLSRRDNGQSLTVI